ncbi:MAG: P-loop ATPase, Sll1717 family [Candidatus Electronema sp. V4]|uniref:P-loop ATPase, Sll1717 family n=1 Tax=Candidatus Electronema sp. V4 TaxID=3454756 RepID=UPI004055678F
MDGLLPGNECAAAVHNQNKNAEKKMAKAVGFVDAYQDKSFLDKCFIQTRCFRESLEPEVNYICGRRGSGKSAIVLNLKKQKKYHYIDDIKGVEFYQQFVDILKPHMFEGEHVNYVYVFSTIWRHLILTTAMNAIISSAYKSDYDCITGSDTLMYEYLKSEKFLGKRPLSLWQKLINVFKKSVNEIGGKQTIAGEILKQVTNILENDDFIAAESALKERLSCGPKCLVVVDTILDYFKKEEVFIACIEGLIYAVLELTCTKYHQNLEIKCCIPGEVYPHIQMWEKTKVQDHLLFIEWTPKDLIRMISKRLMYHLVSARSAKQREFKDINWENYNDVKRKAWDRYFPDSVVNAVKKIEDTHTYVLRHTQQTPREIIRIVNEIISNSFGHEDDFDNLNSSDLQLNIVKGVHKAIKLTMNELIGSNKYLMPYLDKVLSISFQSKTKIMSIQEMRKYLSHSKKYWRQSESLVDGDNVISDLISIGFIGLILNFNDEKSIMYKTRFYYLSPDIGLDVDGYYAIHPIFYDSLNIKRESSRFVYPVSDLMENEYNADDI